MHKNKTLFDMLELDPTLFSGFTVPTGVNSAIIIQLIQDQSGELYTWIQDVARLKTAITNWSTYRIADWTKALTAMTEQYNPIYNYFREELGTETIARHKGTKTSSNEDVTDTPGVSITNTGSVVAYDSSAESETGQSVSTPTGYNTRTADATKNYVTVEDLDSTHYDKDEHSFTDRVTQGNIGTTQTADMIRNELGIRFENSIAELIAAEFEDKFMIQVY